MSDLSPEDLERLKQRNAMFAALDLGLMFRQHAESGHVLNVLKGYIEGATERAVEALVRCSPAATETIADHMVSVRAYIFLRDTIGAILAQGAAAEQSVAAMDAGAFDQSYE